MKVSNKTLDELLLHLVNMPDRTHYCKDLRIQLLMDKETMDAALSKLEADGYIKAVLKIEEEPGYQAIYLNEKGRAFAAKSSYRKITIERWTFWIQVIGGTLLALIAVLLSLRRN